MTPEERAEARRLVDVATPGPWDYDYMPNGPCGAKCYKEIVFSTATYPYKTIVQRPRFDSGGAKAELADAKFIAASRTLVPQLLDALEAAERELNDVLDYAGHHNHCPAAVYSVGVPVFCNCGWDNLRRKHREP